MATGTSLTIGSGGLTVTDDATLTFTGTTSTGGTITAPRITVGGESNGGISTLNLQTGTLTLTPTGTVVVGAGTDGSITQGFTPSATSGGTASSSTVTLGSGGLTIGRDADGSYTLNQSSILQTVAGTSTIITLGTNAAIVTGTVSSGTLNLNDTSVLNLNSLADLQIGVGNAALADTGVVNQNGSSVVNLKSGSRMEIGLGSSATGAYNLQGGSLTATGSRISIGNQAFSTGTLTQSAGVFTTDATTPFYVGESGAGTYNLSGGTATLGSGMTLGLNAFSSGTVNQSGGTLNSTGVVTVGNNGTGAYNLSGGTANFNNNLAVGAGSSFTQSGGNANIGAGKVLTVNGTYLLGGGTLTTSSLVGVGTFTFGGGTLKVGTGGALVDGFSSALTGDTTIDVTNNDATINGSLSGAGKLTVTGSHTLNLNAANTYTGGTAINQGTLRVSLNNLVNSKPIVLTNGGTLDASGTTADTYSTATLGGTGSFLSGAHTVVLTQQNTNISNLTTIGAGGRLQVYGGTFGNAPGGGAGGGITGGGSFVLGGASLVAGPLTVPSSGTANFVGDATYTGSTTVNNGFTLKAHGLNGAFTNNGNFISNRSPGNININGNFTQTATGKLTLTVNPTAHDNIIVIGSGNVAGSLKVNSVGTGTYTIISTTGALSTVGLTLVPSTSPLVTQTIFQVGNLEKFTSTQNSAVPFATTPNQAAVAGALDQFRNNPPALLIPTFTGLDNATTGAQIAAGLQSLTPSSLQYMNNIILENSTFMAQNVGSTLANVRNGQTGLDTSGLSFGMPGFSSGLGRSLTAYYAPAPNGVNYYPQSAEDVVTAPPAQRQQIREVTTSSDGKYISDSPAPEPQVVSGPTPTTETATIGSRFTGFISGDVIFADLKQNQSDANAATSKADYTAGDVAAGVAFRMTSNLAAGILFDYNHTDARTDSNGSKTKVDSYSPGVYGTFYKDGFYVNGLGSYGFNQYSNNRVIALPGVNLKADSSPKGNRYLFNGDLGYDFHPDAHWIVGPMAGLQYTHIDIDSFNESGAGGASLAVDSQNTDSLRSHLGGQATYQVKTGALLLQPHLTAAWQHEFLDTSYGITSNLSVPGATTFPFQTASQGRDSALIGIGLSGTLDNSMSAYINYLVEVGQYDYFVQSVQGGFKSQF